MKLKILFWGLGYVIKRNFKKFEKFRNLFAEDSLDFALSVKDTSIGKRFALSKDNCQVDKNIGDAELKIIFNRADQAYEILTSKDRNSFMRGIQDKKINIEGDFNKIALLQKVMGKLSI